MNRIMRHRYRTQARGKERGQTIALVAVSLVSLLAMAALAIDVVTLYVARGQAERAADAAAVAGAKVLADAGVTTDPTNASVPSIWTRACTLAIQQATAVAEQNLVSGQAASTVAVTFPNAPSPDCSASCSLLGGCTFGVNPRVSVSLQVTGLPTFFSKIWSRAANSVGATALAEAFNPSGLAIPVAPRCVKPLLLPNCDPGPGPLPAPCSPSTTYFDPGTGQITNPGSGGIIGRQLILAACSDTGGCSQSTPKSNAYFPVSISSTPSEVCPGNCSVALPSPNGFENDLACCNWAAPLVCGLSTVTVDTTDPDPGGAGGPAAVGGQCLIHKIAPSDQDSLDTSLNPYAMKAGANNPLIGKTTGASLAAGDVITTSDSVVTLPIYDNTVGLPAGSATIIGFLQGFITDVDATGKIDVTVLNVAGCGSGTSGNAPISGAGPTLPVRLIHN